MIDPTAAPQSATNPTAAPDTTPQNPAPSPAPTQPAQQTSPTPQQPAQTAAPSQAAQPAPKVQPQPNAQPQTASNAPAPDPQTIQAVNRASRVRAAAQALAGGPRYRTVIDPSTGTTQRVQVPMSRADIGLAIAMEAISGALSGLGQRGPGAEGRAALAGAQTTSDAMQTANQQAEAQAQSDAQAKAGALARQASIYEQNSRTVLNTQQAERLGLDSLKDAVEQNAPLLQSYKDAGVVAQESVTQDALMDGLKSGKYNGTSMTAIPDGWTNVPGKGYEQTFSLITNPAEKVSLTQDQVDAYAAAHVRGFPKGMKIPAIGYPVAGYVLANANAQLLANKYMIQEASDVRNTLAKSDDQSSRELANGIPDLGKLMDDPQRGLALQNALPKLQKYMHHDGTGDTFFQALVNMSQPTRPNPQNPKQPIDNASDANAANVIVSALGNGDAQKGWQVLKAYHDAITPAPIKSEAEAEGIATDPASTPRQVAQAKRYLALSTQQKAAEASAKKGATGTVSGTGNAAQFAHEQPVNGVRANYLNSLPATQQELVRSIGEGRTELSSRTASTKEGKALMEQVTTAFPGYDFSRAPEYAATRKAFTSGKTADAINALNTAMGHMLTMYQNATLGGPLPVIGAVERAAGNQSAIDLANAKTALVDELGRAYRAGALTDQEAKAWKGRIDVWSPSEIKGNAASFVQLLDSKLSSYEAQWKNGSPPGAVAPIQILSPEARNAYQTITGRQPLTGNGQTQPSPAGARQVQIPAGAQIGRDGQGRIVGYKLPNGTYVSLGGSQ